MSEYGHRPPPPSATPFVVPEEPEDAWALRGYQLGLLTASFVRVLAYQLRAMGVQGRHHELALEAACSVLAGMGSCDADGLPDGGVPEPDPGAGGEAA